MHSANRGHQTLHEQERTSSSRVDHLYVHVPFCSGKCAYCNLYSRPFSEEACDAFLESLKREAALRLASDRCRQPRTVYIGGGTPSILPSAQLQYLVAILRTHVSLSQVEEWTVEGNPGTWSLDKLKVLREAGATRISLGVQSMQNDILAFLGRRHRAEDVVPTIQLIRRAGITDIGVDLIAALPDVSAEAWGITLRQVSELDIQHVSVYALTLEPGTDLDARSRNGEFHVPGETAQLVALRAARKALEERGFARYEISNYARPGHESRHNLAYWRGKDYIGLGPAASSRVGPQRWANEPSLDAYVSALLGDRPPPGDSETLTEAADAGERLAFAFRLAEGVDLRDHPPANENQRHAWDTALNCLRTNGFLTLDDGKRWRLSPKGWNHADAVAEALLAE